MAKKAESRKQKAEGHRAFRVVLRDGQYAIHEVFYNDEGRVIGSTQDAVSVRAESLEDLKAQLGLYAQALDELPLDFKELESEAEQRRQTTG